MSSSETPCLRALASMSTKGDYETFRPSTTYVDDCRLERSPAHLRPVSRYQLGVTHSLCRRLMSSEDAGWPRLDRSAPVANVALSGQPISPRSNPPSPMPASATVPGPYRALDTTRSVGGAEHPDHSAPTPRGSGDDAHLRGLFDERHELLVEVDELLEGPPLRPTPGTLRTAACLGSSCGRLPPADRWWPASGQITVAAGSRSGGDP